MVHPVKIAALFLLALGFAMPAHALTQVEALSQAAAVKKQGSDESLQNSTTNAMKALMALGEQDHPSAMQHGYKAFGEYRTSQDLDADRIRSRIRQIDLFTTNLTVNSKVPTNLPAPEVYLTTYARLDPAFLRQGDAKSIADEFEKKTGMRRETFLKKMAQVSDTPLSSDDPNLTSKVMGKFSRFLDDIPNDKFREKLQAEIDASTPKSRKDIILTGAKHAFEWLASKGINMGTKARAIAEVPVAEPSRAPASEAAVLAVEEHAAPVARAENPFQSAKKDFTRYMAPTDSGFRGVDRERFEGDGMGGVLQAAVDQERETIFSRISRRYQVLTPSMVHWDTNGR